MSDTGQLDKDLVVLFEVAQDSREICQSVHESSRPNRAWVLRLGQGGPRT